MSDTQTCPACGYEAHYLAAHLLTVHGEELVMVLDE
jgi:hypothetical protein